MATDLALSVVLVADAAVDAHLAAVVAASAGGAGLTCVATEPMTAVAAVAAAVTDGEARVAVVGIGAAGDVAVEVAAGDGRVLAIAVVGATVSPATVELVATWPEVPVLAVADPSDRRSLAATVDAYLASANPASELLAQPLDASAAERVGRWLGDRLRSANRPEEVVVTTSDGWELHGNRWLPDRGSPVPGVVLLHTGRSDRAIFTRLERLLAAAGFAVLNLDWRGRGMSTGRGSYLDLTKEEFDARWRDGLAALDHLAARPEVDADRLATVGAVQGAEIAARAAQRDTRVKAVVLLTGYVPADEAEASHLTGGGVEVFAVSSTAHGAVTESMRALHAAASGAHTRYVEYPGALLGYQLFDIDPSLEPAIVGWLAEVLGR